MKTNLLRDLDRSGWHSSIMTTYSVDPAFYDESIDYRLRINGCQNNILMADTVMLKGAISATPEAFRNAGQLYVMAPIGLAGCFHPKVHLRLGVDKSRLIIGSANATAAGWGKNQEIVTAIDWSRRGDKPNQTVTAPLIKKAYDYLCSWLTKIPGDTVKFKLEFHRRHSPWLNDMQANDGPIVLSDYSAIDLLCERGDGKPGMFERLLSLTEDETIRRLVIVSPYWDSDLATLRDLRKSLASCQTIIALNPETNEFPIDALDGDDPTVFADIRDKKDAHRFLHAKIFLIETDAADHLLFGSANCSGNALGRIGNRAKNAEVSVYRRLPRGGGLDVLKLDLSKLVERDGIRRTVPDAQMFKSGSSAVPAGMIERVERLLTWFPPSSADSTGASILVGGDTLALVPVDNGRFQARIQSDPVLFPLIVRVKFRNGKTSDPVIVHDKVSLTQASSGVADQNLQSAFNQIFAGKEFLIDLIREAHRLFAPEGGRIKKQGHASEKDECAPTESNHQEHKSADEFRRAVELQPGTGKSGRFGLQDSSRLNLLAIILHGVTDVGGKEARKRIDDERRDLRGRKTEDGDENDKRSDKPATDNSSMDDSNAEERFFAPTDIQNRKRQLLKAMKAFESMLDQIAQDPMLISSRLKAQTVFILDLMRLACAKDHLLRDGTRVRLMRIAPESRGGRELTFAYRAWQVLKPIWIGSRDAAPLLDHLRIDHYHESMPAEDSVLIAMSRWAVARAFLSASASKPGKGIAKALGNYGVIIFRSSIPFHSLVNTESEQRFFGDLDASLGLQKNDTDDLMEQCRKFAIEAEGQVNEQGSKSE